MTHPEQVPLRKKGKLKWLLAFGVTSIAFFSGLVVGVFLTMGYIWKRAIPKAPQTPSEITRSVIKDMKEDLHINPRQSKRLQGIFLEHFKRMEILRKGIEPRVKRELDLFHNKVIKELEPRQAKKWSERFEHMRRLMIPPPGFPPPPGAAPPGTSPPGFPPPPGAAPPALDRSHPLPAERPPD